MRSVTNVYKCCQPDSARRNSIQMRLKILNAVSLAIASAALPALAQNSAEITGSASDATGALIAGVTVTITNTATNQARKVNTNAAGAYDTPYLAPGVYERDSSKPRV